MIPIDPFERRLPDDLADLAAERTPPYVTDLLARTAQQRQRPAWTFPERWPPMTIALRRPMLAPPTRLVVVGLVVLAALLATPLLFRPTLVPAIPGGPTPQNGVIAYSHPDGHSVRRLDPTIDEASPWLYTDIAATHLAWSPDGTRSAYAEERPDGSTSIVLACEPGREACGSLPAAQFTHLRLLRWSPDGSKLLVVSEVGDIRTRVQRDSVTLVPSDPSDPARLEVLDLGMPVDWATWHPDGTSLLVKGVNAGGVPKLYVVPLDGARTPREILSVDATTPLFARWGASEYLWDPAYSPDGSTILYSTVVDLLPRQASDQQNARARMVDADGTHDRLFEISPDSNYELAAGWAPDGTRVAIAVQHFEDHLLAISPVEDTTRATLVGPDPAIGSGVLWSPDGTMILTWGVGGDAALVDATTGTLTPLETDLPLEAAWQPVPR
jgi:Tol biopolymer transport system component